MRKIAFIVPPSVEILDLAGPAQVFTEAKFYGFETELEFYSYKDELESTSGLSFGKVKHYSEAALKAGDYLFLPGMDFEYVSSMAFRAEHEYFRWLKEISNKNVTVCSV